MTLDRDHYDVLVADDNADDRFHVAHQLQKGAVVAGIRLRIREVVDGSSALRQLRENSFDLAILDGEMPGMSGSAVFRALDHGSQKPLIILSTGTENPAHHIDLYSLLDPRRMARFFAVLNKNCPGHSEAVRNIPGLWNPALMMFSRSALDSATERFFRRPVLKLA